MAGRRFALTPRSNVLEGAFLGPRLRGLVDFGGGEPGGFRVFARADEAAALAPE